jgi:hypothetical protein
MKISNSRQSKNGKQELLTARGHETRFEDFRAAVCAPQTGRREVRPDLTGTIVRRRLHRQSVALRESGDFAGLNLGGQRG